MTVEYNPATTLPKSTTTYDPVTGIPDMQIKYGDDGETVIETTHFDKDGNPK